ncbi:MAG: Transcriptional regulator, RpiR family [Firmicutes bacterium]|nr:Transcriptional regulator, RpiR family [Bacillota bacterium]MDI6706375.1 MurR/RpiR family transcriptional regulator [Bacillota bacterium]
MNEPKEDLIKLIQHNFPKLSKGQKLIAEYIMSHYEKAAFMTAAKLGERVGVSESTVVRFAIALGYDGYPRLQKALQELIKTKLTTVQRIEMSSDLVSEDDVARKVLKSDMDNIRATMEEVDIHSFDKVVDKIIKAKHVYIIGLRTSTVLAEFLGYYLNLILENVRVVSQGISEIYEQLFNAEEGDIVIAISFPRYSRRTVEALSFVKKQGAEILAITDSPLSPLLNYADYTLYAKSNMASFVDSLVAPMSMINSLIIAVSMREKEKVTDIFGRLEEIWGQYNIYSVKDKNGI